MISLAFVNRRVLDGEALVVETAVHQAQFGEATAMYDGTRGTTAAEIFEAYRAKDARFSRGDYSIELWDVLEAGSDTPRFEYWVQGAGDGMLFEYGTTDSPGSIGSTQHRFEAYGADEDDAETAALVRALQVAGDRDL